MSIDPSQHVINTSPPTQTLVTLVSLAKSISSYHESKRYMLLQLRLNDA